MNELFDRYHAVQAKIHDACKVAGRNIEDVTLVAVSKFHPIGAIAAVASYGQKDFGENYIQEALAKIAQLPQLNWHAIGNIQSKKAKDIVGKFQLLHALSSHSLCEELAKRMSPHEKQDVLIQVNIGHEDQKSGILPENMLEYTQKIKAYANIQISGFMCIPPFNDDACATRPYFTKMRQLRDHIEKELDIVLPHLSMGMSGDFTEAICEGATIIRVGTDIFGQRT